MTPATRLLEALWSWRRAKTAREAEIAAGDLRCAHDATFGLTLYPAAHAIGERVSVVYPPEYGEIGDDYEDFVGTIEGVHFYADKVYYVVHGRDLPTGRFYTVDSAFVHPAPSEPGTCRRNLNPSVPCCLPAGHEGGCRRAPTPAPDVVQFFRAPGVSGGPNWTVEDIPLDVPDAEVQAAAVRAMSKTDAAPFTTIDMPTGPKPRLIRFVDRHGNETTHDPVGPPKDLPPVDPADMLWVPLPDGPATRTIVRAPSVADLDAYADEAAKLAAVPIPEPFDYDTLTPDEKALLWKTPMYDRAKELGENTIADPAPLSDQERREAIARAVITSMPGPEGGSCDIDYRAAALVLFNLLDDIDTLDDACREDDSAFRRLALVKAQRREDVGASFDGYMVAFIGERAYAEGNPEVPEDPNNEGAALTPGTLVTLRSGGPVMTVVEVDGDIVYVAWFVEGDLSTREFPSTALVRA